MVIGNTNGEAPNKATSPPTMIWLFKSDCPREYPDKPRSCSTVRYSSTGNTIDQYQLSANCRSLESIQFQSILQIPFWGGRRFKWTPIVKLANRTGPVPIQDKFGYIKKTDPTDSCAILPNPPPRVISQKTYILWSGTTFHRRWYDPQKPTIRRLRIVRRVLPGQKKHRYHNPLETNSSKLL